MWEPGEEHMCELSSPSEAAMAAALLAFVVAGPPPSRPR